VLTVRVMETTVGGNKSINCNCSGKNCQITETNRNRSVCNGIA